MEVVSSEGVTGRHGASSLGVTKVKLGYAREPRGCYKWGYGYQGKIPRVLGRAPHSVGRNGCQEGVVATYPVRSTVGFLTEGRCL